MDNMRDIGYTLLKVRFFPVSIRLAGFLVSYLSLMLNARQALLLVSILCYLCIFFCLG